MSNSSPPLIQTLTPERWAGWSMDFIGAGFVGLLVKNGQLVRRLEPGRHFSFALPFLEQCELVLVDSKVRNLEVLSHGDFLSSDQFLVNVSLSVMYQVIDPKRIALELSDPIAALVSAVKDHLGVIVNQMRLDELTQQGRVQIRQHLLNQPDSFYLLGFNLEDVRVSDISFPQKRGVVRQVEGLSARQEAEHEAMLKAQVAQVERTAHVQQINIGAGLPVSPDPVSLEANPDPTLVSLAGQTTAPRLTPAQNRAPLPPTALADDGLGRSTARLVHRETGAIAFLSTIPFTIGREPTNHLVPDNPQCSRNHARIDRVPGTFGTMLYQLIDVGSSNGTLLNGQRLAPNQPFPLHSGDVVKMGSDEWTFEAN
ncbi:MAG TPA: SPFH domain-containing protein [Crinalium sp.]|jgi:hypothetical protein